jgi:hypothetical protein
VSGGGAKAMAGAGGEAALSPRLVTAFDILLGRQPTEVEQVRLFKLKEAFGLSNNDETWMLWLGLQHHEWLYEQHPARIEEAVKAAVAGVRSASEAAVAAEVARARGMLEKEVAKAAASVADSRVETTRRLARWWACAGLVLFGGFAMVCGFELGRGGLPFWMRRDVALEMSAAARVAGAILGAPAGWTAWIALIPVWVTWGRLGWAKGSDEVASRKARVKGWALFSAAVLAGLAAAGGVFWLVGGLLGPGQPRGGHPSNVTQIAVTAWHGAPVGAEVEGSS